MKHTNKFIKYKGFKLYSDLPFCLPDSCIEYNRASKAVNNKAIIAIFAEDNEGIEDTGISKKDFIYLLKGIEPYIKHTDIYTNYGIEVHSHDLRELQEKYNFSLHKTGPQPTYTEAYKTHGQAAKAPYFEDEDYKRRNGIIPPIN